jgi:CTP synthase
MRLGVRACHLAEGTKAHALYESTDIRERHRHRYEVNPQYIEQLQAAGMLFSGKDDTKTRMEIMEIPEHPFYVGTQFHPEFTSRPLRQNPVFKGFITAASARLES